MQTVINNKLDHRIWSSSDGLRINLSKERTLKTLEGYISELKKAINDGKIGDDLIDHMLNIPFTQDLFSRFFLCIGDDVNENRKLIVSYSNEVMDGNKYLGVLGRFFKDSRQTFLFI